MNHGSTVTFGPKESKLTTEDGKQFNIVQNVKLFYLETDNKLCAVKGHSLKDLHVLMGHCNISDHRKLRSVVKGIKIKDSDIDVFCETRCRSKQTHQPMSKKPNTRATSPLEHFHSDLTGPVTSTAKGGFRWAMCFVDDYS